MDTDRDGATTAEVGFPSDAVADVIPHMVWMAGPDGAAEYYNRLLLDYAGLDYSGIVGSRWKDLVHPDDRPATLTAWEQAVRTGDPFRIEYRLRRHDGVYRWHIGHAWALKETDGRVVRWIGTCTDIDDLKLARESLGESERRYRELFESNPHPMWVYDTETLRFLDVNDAAVDRYGYSRDEFLAMTLKDIRPPEDIPALLADLAKPHSRFESEAHWRHRRKDGTIRDVEVSAHAVPYGDRRARLVLVLDVTERLRAEAELKRTADLLRAVALETTDAVFVKDRAGRYLLFNPAASRFVGRPVEDVLGRDDTELFDPASAKHVMDRDRRVTETGLAETEEEVLTAAGVTRTYLATKAPYRDERGEIIGTIGISRDITDRKRAEEERDRLFDQLRLQIERMPLAYLLTDAEFRYTLWNPTAERVFGFTAAEALGRHPFDMIVPGQSRTLVEDVFARLRAGDMNAHGTCENVTRDGRTIVCEWHNTPLFATDGAFLGILSLAQDVTERKRAEEELRLRDRAIQAVTQGIVITDPARADNPIVYASDGFVRMTGYALSEILGRNCRFLQGEETNPATAAELGRAVRQARSCTVEILNYRKDGSSFWNQVSVSPVRDGDGKLTHYVGSQSDVTDRRSLAAERDELLGRLQLQIERMPLAYVLFDADFRIIDWNPAAERTFGYTKAEILDASGHIDLLVPPSVRELAEEILNRVRGGDMAAHSVNENVTRDGRTITCEWYNTPLMSEDGRFTGLFCLAQDITDRKLLEEQFRQSQKMDAIGQLAGGIAHDFNNLLTIITGYTELILARLAPNDPSRELLEEVRKAGERSAGLTRQLLAFSRRQVLEPRVLDLNVVIRDTEKMLRRVIGEDVKLIASLDPNLGAIKADPGQIEQVLLNLAVNARDAMPTGGELSIVTRNVDPDEHFQDVWSGSFVMIAISDTGCGMAPEVRDRIFEPFFTTKGAGQGTGLGLAVVHGIVAQSGGTIEVESEPEQGATFRVILPRVEEVSPASTAPAVSDTVPGGHETILLVEDEDRVRTLTSLILRRNGYVVLEAGDGHEALRLAESHGGRIDLLMTDVVMPDLGGRQVAERLLAVRSDLKVLYLSGYMDDAVVRHGIASEQVNFLRKPFTPANLTAKVRAILDDRPDPIATAG